MIRLIFNCAALEHMQEIRTSLNIYSPTQPISSSYVPCRRLATGCHLNMLWRLQTFVRVVDTLL